MAYRILVPLDGSTFAERALPVAVDIARRTGGAMQLLRVHAPAVPLVAIGDLSAPIYDPAWDDELRAIATDYLGGVAARLRQSSRGALSTVVRDHGDVAEQIERSADEFGADLIVMTTHGKGGASLSWFGSVTDGVLRHSKRLTLVVPEQADATAFAVRRILVAIDGSRAADAAMHAAAELARVYGAELELVQVVAPPLSGDMLRVMSTEGLDRFDVDLIVQTAKQDLDAAAMTLRIHGRTVSTLVLVNAHTARALLDRIRETSPDLVALGTHGRGLSRLFVGSVVDKVMRGCGTPVLVQRVSAHVEREAAAVAVSHGAT
jgi:nucleotide-binding universal stress UspA family protein